MHCAVCSSVQCVGGSSVHACAVCSSVQCAAVCMHVQCAAVCSVQECGVGSSVRAEDSCTLHTGAHCPLHAAAASTTCFSYSSDDRNDMKETTP